MFVSALDENFISLKRAAIMIAREQFGFEPREFMEMFKHALFMHEFERKEIAVPGHENSDALNLPLLRIEAPPTQRTVRGLPPEDQPQELFPVYAQTVAEVLNEREALPGTAETWPMFNESPYSAVAMDNALHDLARIPYGAYPAKGQDILGAILLSRAKLAVWMQAKKYALPSFLKDVAARAGRIH